MSASVTSWTSLDNAARTWGCTPLQAAHHARKIGIASRKCYGRVHLDARAVDAAEQQPCPACMDAWRSDLTCSFHREKLRLAALRREQEWAAKEKTAAATRETPPRSCAQCGSTRPATKCPDCGSWVCDRPEYIANQYSSSPDEPSCQQEHAQSHRKPTP